MSTALERKQNGTAPAAGKLLATLVFEGEGDEVFGFEVAQVGLSTCPGEDLSFHGEHPQIVRDAPAALDRVEGVRQRGIRLQWTDAVVSMLCEVGYDRQYGARPLACPERAKVTSGL